MYTVRKFVIQSRADTKEWVAEGHDIHGAMCIVIWRGRYLASGNTPQTIQRYAVDIRLNTVKCPSCVPINNGGRKWTSHYSYKMNVAIDFAQD